MRVVVAVAAIAAAAAAAVAARGNYFRRHSAVEGPEVAPLASKVESVIWADVVGQGVSVWLQEEGMLEATRGCVCNKRKSQ